MSVLSKDFVDRLVDYSAVDSSGERKLRSVVEAFTQKEFTTIREGNEQDVERAFAKARIAQKQWADAGVAHRAKVLADFGKLLHSSNETVIKLIQVENGKAFKYAQEEMLDCYMTTTFYSGRAAKILKTRNIPTALPVLSRGKVSLSPQGVVGVIAPWNFPLILSVGDAVAALIAGNAVVLKPASSTPLCALFAAELLYKAGVPRDVFSVIPGPGAVVGNAIINRADHIVFTGSTENGRKIAQQAAGRLVDISAELGGKNPMIVSRTANVKKAASMAVRAAFTGGGQVCVAMERIYVERAIYQQFVQELALKTKSLRIKPDYSVANDVGSLSTAEQLATTEKHVEDARAKGATIVAGGKHRPDLGPLFYEPTVLTGVTGDMLVFKEETFGPVVSVYPVDSIDEAVVQANASEYGLSAAVISGSYKESVAIGDRLRVGTVNINDGYAITWTTKAGPMGGVGQSGIGRRHGIHGLTRFTDPKLTSAIFVLGFEKLPGLSSDRSVKLLPAILAISERIPRWHKERY